MDMLNRAKEAISGFFAKEQQEFAAPGPGTVGPTIETKGQEDLVTLPFTEKFITDMFEELDRAQQRIAYRKDKWDMLLKAYLPTVESGWEELKTNSHFRNVHTKMGKLFYRSPDLMLTPKDPSPAQNQIPNPNFNPMMPMPGVLPFLTMEDIISVKQAVLQQALGRDGIKAERLMDEQLFDVLQYSGMSAAKLGYRCVYKQVQMPKLGPPQQPGTILGLTAEQMPAVPQTDEQGNPIMEMIPVPVFEEAYWRKFSLKKLLFDSGLRSTRFDEDATYMCMIFFMKPEDGKKHFKLTDEEMGGAMDDELGFQHPGDENARPKGLLMGYELWMKSSFYTEEVHPQAMSQLVLFKGVKRPLVWRPSPDQTFNDRGELTQDSLIGFPIRVLALRDCTDASYIDPDSAFTNPQVKELNTWRRQAVKMREAAIGKYLVDEEEFDETELTMLKTGDVGTIVKVKAGSLKEKGAKGIVDTTAQVRQTNDDYQGQAMIKDDMDETLGVSATQAGTPTDTVRSATEVASFGMGSQERSDKERSRTVDYYLDGARMIDTLLMRYTDQNRYIQIVGQEGAARMMMWNKAIISGQYIYDVTPDSQRSPDTAQQFQQDLKLYNVGAPDPLFNRAYMLRMMARRVGYDPSKLVLPPMQVAAGTQPPHGGQATAGTSVNKKENSISGGKENAPGAENARESEIV